MMNRLWLSSPVDSFIYCPIRKEKNGTIVISKIKSIDPTVNNTSLLNLLLFSIFCLSSLYLLLVSSLEIIFTKIYTMSIYLLNTIEQKKLKESQHEYRFFKLFIFP